MNADLIKATLPEYHRALDALVSHGKVSMADWNWTPVSIYMVWSSTGTLDGLPEWIEESGANVVILDARLCKFVVCRDEVGAVAFKMRWA